jgi:predicted DNA-binding protein (MmcQ/YjbR family)
MDLAKFREYCLSKPQATEGTPFGPDVVVFKVGGKMFALASLNEVPTTANLKCDPDLALELRDRYEQVRPGYHMNKKHWNTVEIENGIPDAELRRMIDHSYDLVVNSLSKATRVHIKGGSASPKTMLIKAAKPRKNSNALRRMEPAGAERHRRVSSRG